MSEDDAKSILTESRPLRMHFCTINAHNPVYARSRNEQYGYSRCAGMIRALTGAGLQGLARTGRHRQSDLRSDALLTSLRCTTRSSGIPPRGSPGDATARPGRSDYGRRLVPIRRGARGARRQPQVAPGDIFLIREVHEALMLSLPRYYLRLLVHARPLVSVAVSGDRHSVSYSPLGSARSGPDPNLQIRSLVPDVR
jgi:hypothetical protein